MFLGLYHYKWLINKLCRSFHAAAVKRYFSKREHLLRSKTRQLETGGDQ
jgi:hypothetical protein